MPTLCLETHIAATVERCFDLARNIDLHCETAMQTNERAIAGVTRGLIGMGETVTFEGIHFGLKLCVTSQIMEFEPPSRFVDEMISGPFQFFRHLHEFAPCPEGTVMKDTLTWTSPLGFLGKLADAGFVKWHLRNFMLRRNAQLKTAAEANQTN